MTDRGSAQPGPVRLTENSRVAFRPASHGSISAGLWAERRRVNRDVSVPEGWDHLHEAGNFHNLELAAGLTHRRHTSTTCPSWTATSTSGSRRSAGRWPTRS